MRRHKIINGSAVCDPVGPWVLLRDADALLEKREHTIKELNNRICILKRQLKRKRKDRKLRTKEPFKGRVKLTIQISGGKFYSMSAKGLVKRLFV